MQNTDERKLVVTLWLACNFYGCHESLWIVWRMGCILSAVLYVQCEFPGFQKLFGRILAWIRSVCAVLEAVSAALVQSSCDFSDLLENGVISLPCIALPSDPEWRTDQVFWWDQWISLCMLMYAAYVIVSKLCCFYSGCRELNRYFSQHSKLFMGPNGRWFSKGTFYFFPLWRWSRP